MHVSVNEKRRKGVDGLIILRQTWGAGGLLFYLISQDAWLYLKWNMFKYIVLMYEVLSGMYILHRISFVLTIWQDDAVWSWAYFINANWVLVTFEMNPGRKYSLTTITSILRKLLVTYEVKNNRSLWMCIINKLRFCGLGSVHQLCSSIRKETETDQPRKKFIQPICCTWLIILFNYVTLQHY